MKVVWPTFSTLPTNTYTLNTTLAPAGLKHMIWINGSTGVNIVKSHSSQQVYSFWWRGGEFPALNRESCACTSITDCCVTKELIQRCAVELNYNIQLSYDPANSLKPLNSCLSRAAWWVCGIKHVHRRCRSVTVLWGPIHEVGWYTLSLRPPHAADNNKNKSAPWLPSSNDRGAHRVTEITPHPGFLICFQLSTSLCQQTHHMELKSRESLIQPTESFTPNGSFQARAHYSWWTTTEGKH